MPLSLLLTDKFQKVTNGTPGALQNSSCNIACEASTSSGLSCLKTLQVLQLPFLVSALPGVREGSS